MNVTRESVGVGPDHLDGFLPVGFVDPDGTIRS